MKDKAAIRPKPEPWTPLPKALLVLTATLAMTVPFMFFPHVFNVPVRPKGAASWPRMYRLCRELLGWICTLVAALMVVGFIAQTTASGTWATLTLIGMILGICVIYLVRMVRAAKAEGTEKAA